MCVCVCSCACVSSPLIIECSKAQDKSSRLEPTCDGANYKCWDTCQEVDLPLCWWAPHKDPPTSTLTHYLEASSSLYQLVLAPVSCAVSSPDKHKDRSEWPNWSFLNGFIEVYSSGIRVLLFLPICKTVTTFLSAGLRMFCNSSLQKKVRETVGCYRIDVKGGIKKSKASRNQYSRSYGNIAVEHKRVQKLIWHQHDRSGQNQIKLQVLPCVASERYPEERERERQREWRLNYLENDIRHARLYKYPFLAHRAISCIHLLFFRVHNQFSSVQLVSGQATACKCL